MNIYLSEQKSLAFFNTKATPGFWEKKWETEDLKKLITSCKNDRLFVPLVKKYLPARSTVLEGGCGQAHLVHALDYNGFKTIGLDYAEKTVRAVKEAVPELDVRIGDVRKLPFDDNYLDGYVSVGVIEHFWEGYDHIVSEMARTVKKGGYLFVSFPYMSPLRKIKAFFRIYSRDLTGVDINTFYQFALDGKTVRKNIEKKGFTYVKKQKFGGIKGLKDELSFGKSLFHKIYTGNKYIRFFWETLLTPFTSHCILLVFKKVESA